MIPAGERIPPGELKNFLANYSYKQGNRKKVLCTACFPGAGYRIFPRAPPCSVQSPFFGGWFRPGRSFRVCPGFPLGWSPGGRGRFAVAHSGLRAVCRAQVPYTKNPGILSNGQAHCKGASPDKIGFLYGNRPPAAVVGAEPEDLGVNSADSGSPGAAHRAPPRLVLL